MVNLVSHPQTLCFRDLKLPHVATLNLSTLLDYKQGVRVGTFYSVCVCVRACACVSVHVCVCACLALHVQSVIAMCGMKCV